MGGVSEDSVRDSWYIQASSSLTSTLFQWDSNLHLYWLVQSARILDSKASYEEGTVISEVNIEGILVFPVHPAPPSIIAVQYYCKFATTNWITIRRQIYKRNCATATCMFSRIGTLVCTRWLRRHAGEILAVFLAQQCHYIVAFKKCWSPCNSLE